MSDILTCKKRIRGKCIDCGVGITGHRAKRCRKCFAISRKINKNMSRQEYSRNWTIKKKYGIDLVDFETYWQAFKGICGICGKKMEMPTKTIGQGLDVVAIDHNHITGEVRGLLCNACNKGIGFLKEDVLVLEKAIIYLGGKNDNRK